MWNDTKTWFIVKNVVTFFISMAYNRPSKLPLFLPDCQIVKLSNLSCNEDGTLKLSESFWKGQPCSISPFSVCYCVCKPILVLSFRAKTKDWRLPKLSKIVMNIFLGTKKRQSIRTIHILRHRGCDLGGITASWW